MVRFLLAALVWMFRLVRKRRGKRSAAAALFCKGLERRPEKAVKATIKLWVARPEQSGEDNEKGPVVAYEASRQDWAQGRGRLERRKASRLHRI